MPSIEPEELPRRRSGGELLDHIYAEGGRRRRRRIGSVGLSAAAIAIVAGAALVTGLPGGTPQQVATRGPTAPPALGSTTSASVGAVAQVPTSAPTAASMGTSDASQPRATPSTTIAFVTTISPAATPTTQPPATCRNSSDSACGPFHWEPEPAPNAPLVIEVTATPRQSEPRTYDLAVVYTDADALVNDGCRAVDFGDGSTGVAGVPSCAIASCIAAYGAWTPPPPEPGRVEAVVTHTFDKAGTYNVRFSARSGGVGCLSPYASTGDKTVTVVVP